MMKRLCRRRGVWKYVGGLAVCAACVLFLATGLKGQAARTGTVSVESARVRQEASTDAGIAGSLSSGDTVTIVDETESGGSTWLYPGWGGSDRLAPFRPAVGKRDRGAGGDHGRTGRDGRARDAGGSLYDSGALGSSRGRLSDPDDGSGRRYKLYGLAGGCRYSSLSGVGVRSGRICRLVLV